MGKLGVQDVAGEARAFVEHCDDVLPLVANVAGAGGAAGLGVLDTEFDVRGICLGVLDTELDTRALAWAY